MPKKVAEKLEDIKNKKYVFRLEDRSVILINAPSRIEAVKILNYRLKDNGFEYYDFESIMIGAEIKEDGTVISYDSDIEEKDTNGDSSN
jgi:hypothetical protein